MNSEPLSSKNFARPILLGDALVVFVAILWLGLLVGVSFVATPVKFKASSLDLPTALDVGRVTFALFSKVEWTLCLVLFLVTLLSLPPLSRWLFLGALVSILLLQGVWLFPALDVRAERIIAGGGVVGSNLHLFYVGADALKALLLLGLSALTLQRLVASANRQGIAR